MVQEGKKDEVMAPAPTSLEEEKPQSAAEGLANIIALLEKAVKLKDTRLLQGRLLRQTAVVRKHLAKADLAAFLQASLPGGEAQGLLLQAVEQVGGGWLRARPGACGASRDRTHGARCRRARPRRRGTPQQPVEGWPRHDVLLLPPPAVHPHITPHFWQPQPHPRRLPCAPVWCRPARVMRLPWMQTTRKQP
jgi:hypothetical protein